MCRTTADGPTLEGNIYGSVGQNGGGLCKRCKTVSFLLTQQLLSGVDSGDDVGEGKKLYKLTQLLTQ